MSNPRPPLASPACFAADVLRDAGEQLGYLRLVRQAEDPLHDWDENSARVEIGGFEIALDTQLYLPREHSGCPTESTEYPPMLRRPHQGHWKSSPTEPMLRRRK